MLNNDIVELLSSLFQLFSGLFGCKTPILFDDLCDNGSQVFSVLVDFLHRELHKVAVNYRIPCNLRQILPEFFGGVFCVLLKRIIRRLYRVQPLAFRALTLDKLDRLLALLVDRFDVVALLDLRNAVLLENGIEFVHRLLVHARAFVKTR